MDAIRVGSSSLSVLPSTPVIVLYENWNMKSYFRELAKKLYDYYGGKSPKYIIDPRPRHGALQRLTEKGSNAKYKDLPLIDQITHVVRMPHA